MSVEWLLFGAIVLAAAVLLARALPGSRGWPLCVTTVGLAVFGGVQWRTHLQARETSRKTMLEKTPKEGREGFVSSDACRSCHPAQYASWHNSFHRTMTQHATPQSVRGNFNGTRLMLQGEEYVFERRGDEFWCEMVDPDWKYIRTLQRLDAEEKGTPPPPIAVEPPRTWKRVSMLTGSHHMQAYWVPSKYGNLQYSLPFTYVFADERWVPRNDVFLLKPNTPHAQQIWNATCINCHATAAHARQDSQTKLFDTRAAELGIACEACHGPAGEHIRHYSDPALRYASHRNGTKKPEVIVNPAKLDHVKSSETCSRCHAIRYTPDHVRWNLEGIRFVPGGEIEANAPLTRIEKYDVPDSPELRRRLSLFESSFWSDGLVRVSGREFNGMSESPCFKRGELSCLSCHSMHQFADNDDQLKPERQANAACLQCHADYKDKLTQHTRHAPTSAGSLCYNCHMPHTSYGLLKAIRSHTVTSPSVVSTLETGRPNACNLCHLDKSLAWTQDRLHAWYGITSTNLPPDESDTPASLLWLLRGDAGQRALIAWHMGWTNALDASGRDWLTPYLAYTLTDTYSVVRYIGQRSLKRLPGFEKLPYDYIASEAERARVRDAVLAQTAKPSLPPEKITRLLAERKDPPMQLLE
ncbi:MAG TPA: multiheme c-type cytochrome [Verrucomicrobiae bacterium]|nr:multiheme c-type cytochrome [Verrucomicrobiae bacterium]